MEALFTVVTQMERFVFGLLDEHSRCGFLIGKLTIFHSMLVVALGMFLTELTTGESLK